MHIKLLKMQLLVHIEFIKHSYPSCYRYVLYVKCSRSTLIVVYVYVYSGDYYTPNCELHSEGRRATLHMMTDSFTEAPGFRATFTALPSSKEMKQNSKKSQICIKDKN